VFQCANSKREQGDKPTPLEFLRGMIGAKRPVAWHARACGALLSVSVGPPRCAWRRALSSVSFGRGDGGLSATLPASRPNGLEVVEDFVTEEEEAALMQLAQDIMGDRRYETEHYDSVISGFRECFIDRFFDPKVARVVERMRAWAWAQTEQVVHAGIARM
jgi:hypothetical protein